MKEKLNNLLDKCSTKILIGSLAIGAVSIIGVVSYKLGFEDGGYKASADCLKYLNDIADDDGYVDIGYICMRKR